MSEYEREVIKEKLQDMINIETARLRTGINDDARREVKVRIDRLKAIKKSI